ncbi:MAG: ABC transporter ATP-binding protein [Syntrophomonadaceae bacterium]|jgi:cobalt/nickel transport system ATP-binding protein|nr:ABC transporter ATP-binding protein [Syntrophomonadaceae bacterium]
MTDQILKISNLSFSYKEGDLILDGLSLEVFRTDKIGILGPNGAGKTSLFLLIAGVEKPWAGEIYLQEKKIVPGIFNPELGLVFQDSDDQVFNFSVFDDIAFGPRNMGLPRAEINRRVNEALSVLGIQHLARRAPQQLSGGEKRLVAIAGGILAMQAGLAIYDEPTSNLDLRYRRRLINFIKSHKQKAALIASHDLEFVLETCNRVVILDQGRIAADGRPQDIMGDPLLMEQHGLEVPHSLLGRQE